MTNPDNRPGWVSGGASEPDADAREYTVKATDGRTIGVAEYGPSDGFPIVNIHGTPGSRYGGPPPERPDLYERLGVRVIGFDRSGYGLSSRQPGRRVVDAVDDVRCIVDSAGIGKFAVTGGSGGGPHCLAVAALMPEQVTRVACVVGVAPFGDGGMTKDEWLAGMTKGNVDEFTWSLAGEETLRPNLERLAQESLARVLVDPATALGDEYELADADQAIMARPAYQTRIRRTLEESHRHGVDGWIDDDLVFVRPWGFSVADISIPSMIWFGTDDTLVPAAHGEWLARNVPGTAVVRMTGGHMELANRVEDLVGWLAGGTLPADAKTS
ncbi:MAG TPA: alpha/beta fold hydrolase [Actinomycetes bacterium]|nr:alpha/beta fold hydrolase [Actinomycetes bacterium]